jgi:hypothetical protein
VLNCTLRPLYPAGKRDLLDRPWANGRISGQKKLVTVPTELSWLPLIYKNNFYFLRFGVLTAMEMKSTAAPPEVSEEDIDSVFGVKE